MKHFYNLRQLFSVSKKVLQLAQCLAVLTIVSWPSAKLFAQAPAISYGTAHTYEAYQPIAPLTPASTGGAVAGVSFNPTTTTVNTGISDALSVAVGPDGKLYIGESSGQVSVFTPGGGPATVLSTGFGSVSGICVDQAGNVYLADGSFIWEIPAGGGTPATVGNFGQPVNVAVDAADNLYVADVSSKGGVIELFVNRDSYEIRSFQTVSSTLSAIAVDLNNIVYIGDPIGQTFFAINGGNGFSQIAGGISPEAITVDPSGNVYVATSSGLYMRAAAGGSLNLVASGSSFTTSGFAVDANANVYLANGTITETQPTGGYFIKPALLQGLNFDINSGQISGTPGVISANNNYSITGYNANGQGSAALDITITAPQSLAISYSSPQTYIQGTTISPLSPSSTGGVVPPPAFNSSPMSLWSTGDADYGLAMDKAGDFYIGDWSAKEVLKLAKGASSPTVFATGFNSIAGIAIDAAGDVYAADPASAKLWKIPAGGGTAVALGSFNTPYGVATDAAGNVYVADRQSGVYKMAPDGTGQTSISSTIANFVTVDLNGNVFFTDFSGNIDEIPAGGAQKVFTSGGGLFLGITTDASGNVYVIRTNAIAMVPAGGGTFTEVGPSSFGKGAGGLAVDASYNLYWMIRGLNKTNATGGYFISPELPAGLTINPSGGVISGTPVAGAPATNYTVTAFNTVGSAAATVNITDIPLPPAVSYSTPQNYNANTAITPLAPASTGGTVSAPAFNTAATVVANGIGPDFAMDKAGNIYFGVQGSLNTPESSVEVLAHGSSTPTVFASGFYSVGQIATDASGNVYVADPQSGVWKIPAGGGTRVLLGSFPVPNGVAVDAAGNIYVGDNEKGVSRMAADGTGLTSLSAEASGAVCVDLNGNVFFFDLNKINEIPSGGVQKLIYSTSIPHTRPEGLTVDGSGNIYFYVQGGAKSVMMLPAGAGSPLSVLPYSSMASVLMVDAGFNLYWVNSGNLYKASATGGYFASPELPNGLTIDPTSGAISGTPTTTAAATNYTISAFNAGGSATAAINIAVNPQGPVISYSTPQNFTVGTAITALTPANTGGSVASPAFNTAATTLYSGLGLYPRAEAMDKAGNIYVAAGVGTQVLELASGSGTPVVLAGGFTSVEGVAVDASGNVYVADYGGGSFWKIPTGGGTAVKLGSFTQPLGVAIDAAGNIYVSDDQTGVYKLAPDGTGQTNISSTAAAHIAIDLNGNLFFNTDAGNIYEIPAGGAQKVFYQASQIVEGLTTDPSGNVYFTVYSNHRGYIYMLPAAGGTPVQVEPTSSTELFSLLVDSGYNLYYTTFTGSLMKANATGGYFTSPELPNGLAIDPTSGAISGTPTAASAAVNYTVTAFNTGGSGTAALNIGVNLAPPAISYSTPPAYTTGTAITPLTPVSNGGAVAVPAFNTAATTLTDGIGGFVSSSIAMDKAGDIFIGEGDINNNIPNGFVQELAAGSNTPTTLASGFNTVGEMAVDASGNVYMADAEAGKVWKIAPGGSTTSIPLGSLTVPNGVAIDAAGNMYVGDFLKGVYKMAPDGSGQIQLSNLPSGNVTVDLNGNVFFNDLNQILEIPAGGVQKVAYTATANIGITILRGVTSDASGNVYFTQSNKITGNNISMLPAGGGPVVVLSSTSVNGLMVDAGFNLYYTNLTPGGLHRANAVGGYFVSPELPNGLTIDPTSGAISGTPGPATASAGASYTVTAFNTAGSGTAPLNISINLTPPIISYSTPQTYTTGIAITALTPGNTGGAVAAPGFNASATALGAATTDAYTGLAMDNAGNIYIGDNTSKQVLELAPGGTTPGVFASGFGSVDGIAIDASGNIYVADASGASVWEIPAGGGTAVALGSFTAPHGVALDAAGNIYVTNGITGVVKMAPDGSGQISISSIGSTSISVDLNGNVFFASLNYIYELPAGGVQKVFYNSANNVQSLTTDASGNVYFSANGSMYMLPAAGGAAVQVGPGFSPASTPNGLMLDAGHNLYFTNQGVFKANALGGYFASPELPAGLSIDPTSGAISGTPKANSAAANYTVTAFNVDGSSTATVNIAVSLSPPAISYSTPQTYNKGTAITPLAPSSTAGAVGGAGFSGQQAVTTGISDANCVAFDQSGNMYIGENGQVSELLSGTTVAVPIATGFGQVSSIAVDGSGNVYLTDGSVWKIPAGGGPAIGIGTWGLAQGVAVDAANNIYVADVVQGVYKIAPDGSSQIQIDNTSAAGIAADMNGNLVFSSSGGSAVYEIPVGGTRQTVPVNGAPGLTSDLSGNFYILDNFGTLNIIYPGGSTPAVVPNIFGGGTITGLATDAHFNFYGVGGNITEMTPNGAYFISPELPRGMTIDPGSGTISGTPAVAALATNYTAMAFNAAGSGIATVNITVNGPVGDATLSNLAVSQGTLSPVFITNRTNYGDFVADTISSIIVTPITTDPAATVTVNGNPAATPVSLVLGYNTVPVVVTARDGVTKMTYQVLVKRVPSADNYLSAISLTPTSPLTAASGSGDVNYTTTVSGSTASITETPVALDNTATITVNGTPVTSGSASQAIALHAGANTITTVVTAQSGAKRTIIITATRAPLSDNYLTTIYLNPKAALTPASGPGDVNYTASVTYSTASVTLTAITQDPNATLTINGKTVTSGTPSGAIALNPGVGNTITTVVTAQNGATRTIIITVTRAPSNDAYLTGIILTPATPLTASTGSGDVNYAASVAHGISSATETATTQEPNATVTVNGQTVTSGAASQAIALNVGANTITTIITAQDGSTKRTVIITVTRAAPLVADAWQPVTVEKPAETPALADDGILVHQGVSPNGDGIDDFLTIDHITSYPDNRLMIMNRNGQLIYEAKGYDNTSRVFDGHSNKNGQMQLPGTYFYQLDYVVNGITKHKTGFLVLKY